MGKDAGEKNYKSGWLQIDDIVNWLTIIITIRLNPHHILAKSCVHWLRISLEPAGHYHYRILLRNR